MKAPPIELIKEYAERLPIRHKTVLLLKHHAKLHVDQIAALTLRTVPYADKGPTVSPGHIRIMLQYCYRRIWRWGMT